MRTEDDLRSALRVLERETPDAETVLRRVSERTGTGMAGSARRPGRRLLAGVAAAAAVIAIAVAAALVATGLAGRGVTSARDVLRSVPRYYMALIPVHPGSYGPQYAVVRDTLTGKTLATIRPPRPYITFIQVSGAADDRTFVLTAQATLSGSLTSRNKFYEARLDAAGHAVTVIPLALRGVPVSNYFSGAALSPDGTELAVASQDTTAQIAVYSLASGAVRVWQSSRYVEALEFDGSDSADLLSWSRTGIVAFGWNGSAGIVVRHGRPTRDKHLKSAYGEYLLDTNGPGGGLLADSRQPVCSGSNAIFGYQGHLTPDGKAIIMPLAEPVAPGQRPQSCSSASPVGGSAVLPVLEEFSATTGRAIGVVYTSSTPVGGLVPVVTGYSVFWSNSSGSVLVVDVPRQAGGRAVETLGVLSGGGFVPIPGAPKPFSYELAF